MFSGFAYDGEYPVSFAACFGHVDIYDYLIDHGADPDLQDSFGNTALHMVVITDQKDMYTYMVKHHRRPAKTDITNKANLSPLTLASKLGRHVIFKEILELASIEFWRYSNVTCSAYPLTNLDSIGPNGDTNWNSALMIVIDGETDEHLEMLEGGVMRQLLDEKWKTFARRRFFERLVIALIHLALISVVVYLRKSKDLLVYTQAEDAVRFTAEILVCLFCIGILVMEVVEIGSQGFIGFLKNCEESKQKTHWSMKSVVFIVEIQDH
ncbi:hypothetical protein CHS0354_009090 [Potamilus streckersoni]|uniref:Uncharacterized protein n=1 Tax=Potamilus streckersoni TaxID=2493646 RepID=A0AAE0THP3_9BIVA|nr:hypothetical protein CHS0354_009090 [Potamilus streckersoni]